MTSCQNVLKASTNQKWLFLRNESGWLDENSIFDLENYERAEGETKGEVLAGCKAGPMERDCRVEAEYEDGDDWGCGSDFSIDDIFGDSDDDELKVKLKWKIGRKAEVHGRSGEHVATIRVKVKGKAKTEVDIQRDDETGRESQYYSSKSKIKKVFYQIIFDGQEMDLEYENRGWSQSRDRTWSCDLFTATLHNDYRLRVETSEGYEPSDGLLIAYCIATFMNPHRYADEMEREADSVARRILREMH